MPHDIPGRTTLVTYSPEALTHIRDLESPLPLRITENRSDIKWIVGLGAAILVLLLLNPGGYIGGGQDDWRYIEAVRCWREHGPCLPHDHWQTRWPLIAPTAALTSILGESRLTVSLAPLLASVSAVFLLAAVGNKLFGRPVGWLGALAFAAIPAFSFQFTDLTVESTELSLVFGGFLAALYWETEGRAIFAIAAGLLLSLAFQTRETSIVAALFTGSWILLRRSRAPSHFLVYASLGFSLPLLVEFLTFAISAGDPFWRRRLAMHHVLIPSSELLGPVDPQHGPFFNLAYIDHWRRISGIHVHWSLDWLLNLMFNGTAGLSLVMVPLILLLGRKSVDKQSKHVAAILWLAGLAYAGMLALVFALDPKPRVMMVPLAMTSLALALVTYRLKQQGRAKLSSASWAAVLLLWLPLHVGHRRTDVVESHARAWIASFPREIEIDENSRRHLALLPEAQALPPVGSGHRYWIYMSLHGCAELLGPKGLPGRSLEKIDFVSVYAVELRHLESRTSLCLLRWNEPLPSSVIIEAIRRSRNDGPYITGYGSA